MVTLQKINKIGYGFGFGGAFATNAEYTKSHKETLNFFCEQSEGNFIDTSISYGNGDSEKIIDFLKIDTVSKNSKIKKDNYKNSKYLRFYSNKKVKKALGIHKIGNLEKSIKKTIIWYKQSI